MKFLKAVGIRLIVYPVVIVGGGLIVIFAVALVNRVPSPPQITRFYVRVQGDRHIQFAGSVMGIKNGQVTSKTVSGFTPATFDTTGDSVSVAIQKKSPGNGILEVALEKDNKILNQLSTTSEFGMVTLTGR